MFHREIVTPIKELKKAQDAIDKAQERYDKIRDGVTNYDPVITERSTILCKKCGKRSQVRNIQFARYYWYESPHGCMGGACWHSNGFVVVCPKCLDWAHINEPTEGFSDVDVQVMEFRILEKMLKFAEQCNDVQKYDGEYRNTNEIKWRHKYVKEGV